MKKLLVTLLSIVYVVFSYAQRMDYSADLPLDHSIRQGKLDNGMTYFIKHSADPKERGEFYIVHNVGAMQEEDDQNGLAHFLEHMAFNGTKNLPGKMMLEYLESIGVKFGYNVNAYTSRERTVYNISKVPLIRESIVDSVLLVLHDWSHYILCDSLEIEKERGVIREEWRRGDDSRSRMAKATIALQYKDTKYARRDVIGSIDVINNFKHQALTDFYHKWYRTDLQAIILVGDFDVDQMEHKVRALFSKIPAMEHPAPKERYKVYDYPQVITDVIGDPETRAQAGKILFKIQGPAGEEKLKLSALKQKLMLSLATDMIGIRFDRTKNENGERYKHVTAVNSNGFDDTKFIMFTISPVGTEYVSAFEETLYQIERIKRYPFTPDEFSQAVTSASKRLDANSRKFAKPKNEDIISTIVDHFTKGEALCDNGVKNSIEIEILNDITLDEVNANLDLYFSDKNRILFISCPRSDLPNVPTATELFAINEASKQREFQPYLYETTQKDLADFSNLKGSRIVSEKKIEKYQVKEFTLENGVTVYWSYNSDPNAMVQFQASGNGGFGRYTSDDICHANMLNTYMRGKGLGNLNSQELKGFLNPYNVSAHANVGIFSQVISGNSSSKDVEMLMKLTYLHFTAPYFDVESANKNVASAIEGRTSPSKSTLYKDATLHIRFGFDPYRAPLKRSDYEQANLERSVAIYNEIFANAREFQFFVSGHIPEETIKPLIEKYIGSLPAFDPIPRTNHAGGVATGDQSYCCFVDDMVTPKSEIEFIYHGEMAYNARNSTTMEVLKHILSNRYLTSIREERGGTYYVGVSASLSQRPKNVGVVTIQFETDPKLRDELVQIIQDEIDDIILNGPKESEVRDVILYLKKRDQDIDKDSAYWFSRFKELITEGADTRDGVHELLNSISAKEVQQTANEIFSTKNKMLFIYGSKLI